MLSKHDNYPEIFRNEVGGFQQNSITRLLEKRGIIERAPGSKRSTVRTHQNGPWSWPVQFEKIPILADYLDTLRRPKDPPREIPRTALSNKQEAQP